MLAIRENPPERTTPKHLRAEAARWREAAVSLREAAARAAGHEQLRRNAEKYAKHAARFPNATTRNCAAHLADQVAESASSLADFLERTKPVAILPPATILTFLAQDGWHAEALVHVGDEIGLPLLRIEGAPTEEEARAQLRQLAENPQVNEMASRDDYHGMKFRAAIKAATT